jgi:uncharacterized membrane protein YgcG
MKTRSFIIRAAGAAAAAIFMSFGGGQGGASAQPLSSANTGIQTQTAAVPAKAPALSYGAFRAVDMYQRGLRPDLIVSYIKNSSAPYQLSADAIIYMKSLGIPVEIVNAMLQRDIQLREQQAQQNEQGPSVNTSNVTIIPYPQTSPEPPGSMPDAGVIPDDSTVPYDYPDYDQYWPAIVIGGGWGWGGGHRWDHGHGDFGRESHGSFGGGFHGGFGGHGGGGHR